jgi:aerobic-type carbon monoxide dehydrogenase small subunit (CoxS/CutS family)
LIDRFQDRINDLKDKGLTYNKKQGVVVDGAKRKSYLKVIAALEAIAIATAEEFARRNAE